MGSFSIWHWLIVLLIVGPGRACVRAAPDALVREVIDACCAG